MCLLTFSSRKLQNTDETSNCALTSGMFILMLSADMLINLHCPIQMNTYTWWVRAVSMINRSTGLQVMISYGKMS